MKFTPAVKLCSAVLMTISGVLATTSADLEKAWKSSPKDPAAQVAYAQVAPCSLSVALFTAVTTNNKAADSLKAGAFRQLGDYSFVHSAFRTAAGKYGQAYALSSRPEYDYLQAKALAALGDTMVWKCFDRLSKCSSREYVGRAGVLKAFVLMKGGAYDSAWSVLSSISTGDTSGAYHAQALVLKHECALRTGRKDAAAALAKQLAAWNDVLLESDALGRFKVSAAPASAAAPVKVSQSQISASPVEDGTLYTLQVGAFGSIDNATALQKKLEKKFGDVTVLPATMAETVVYRVRVGSFKSKYEADSFGCDSLTALGYNFRSVVK